MGGTISVQTQCCIRGDEEWEEEEEEDGETPRRAGALERAAASKAAEVPQRSLDHSPPSRLGRAFDRPRSRCKPL